MTHIEALKLALEALELLSRQPTDSALDYADNAITAIKAALAQPAQEPVNLRRGDRLRCIETDELCFVWATSTTGKTLIKWSANNFGNYTAEQIGELFWMEPAQQEPQVCCGEYDTCLRACTPRGRHLAQPEQEPVAKYCCHFCFKKSGGVFLNRMILCSECGNKRCPKATSHELQCTNSNEPNQAGSVYTTPQRTEKNFCERCGKRTQDIHTCTPPLPKEKNT